jgi:hypothetical protein
VGGGALDGVPQGRGAVGRFVRGAVPVQVGLEDLGFSLINKIIFTATQIVSCEQNQDRRFIESGMDRYAKQIMYTFISPRDVWLRLRITYDCGQEVELVVSGDADPGLVRGAALDESPESVPSVVVAERVDVGVREIARVQHRLPIALDVVLERPVRIERLPEIGCNIYSLDQWWHSRDEIS